MRRKGTPRKWTTIHKLKDEKVSEGWGLFADEMLFWLNYAHWNIEKELIVNRVNRMKLWTQKGGGRVKSITSSTQDL